MQSNLDIHSIQGRPVVCYWCVSDSNRNAHSALIVVMLQTDKDPVSCCPILALCNLDACRSLMRSHRFRGQVDVVCRYQDLSGTHT